MIGRVFIDPSIKDAKGLDFEVHAQSTGGDVGMGGDSRFHTPRTHKKRLELKTNKKVLKALTPFWVTCSRVSNPKKNETNPLDINISSSTGHASAGLSDSDTDTEEVEEKGTGGYLKKRTYVNLYIRIAKVLYKEKFEPRKFTTMALMDWDDDTQDNSAEMRKYMTAKQFYASLFQIADMWTSAVSEEAYSEFLRKLFLRITRAIPGRNGREFLNLEDVTPFDVDDWKVPEKMEDDPEGEADAATKAMEEQAALEALAALEAKRRADNARELAEAALLRQSEQDLLSRKQSLSQSGLKSSKSVSKPRSSRKFGLREQKSLCYHGDKDRNPSRAWWVNRTPAIIKDDVELRTELGLVLTRISYLFSTQKAEKIEEQLDLLSNLLERLKIGGKKKNKRAKSTQEEILLTEEKLENATRVVNYMQCNGKINQVEADTLKNIIDSNDSPIRVKKLLLSVLLVSEKMLRNSGVKSLQKQEAEARMRRQKARNQAQAEMVMRKLVRRIEGKIFTKGKDNKNMTPKMKARLDHLFTHELPNNRDGRSLKPSFSQEHLPPMGTFGNLRKTSRRVSVGSSFDNAGFFGASAKGSKSRRENRIGSSIFSRAGKTATQQSRDRRAINVRRRRKGIDNAAMLAAKAVETLLSTSAPI